MKLSENSPAIHGWETRPRLPVESLQGRQKLPALRAFTLPELLVLLAVVAVLVFLILPMLAGREHPAPRAHCQNDLKQIGLAFRVWAGDYGDKYPMSVPTNTGGTLELGSGVEMFRHFRVLSNILIIPKMVLCPSDTRKPAKNFQTLENANVSYFVGLDAAETMPAMPLAGDRNLLTNGIPVVPGLVGITTSTATTWSTNLHNTAGNLLLSDGSVQQSSSFNLQSYFNNSGTNLVRLAIP